MFRWLKHLFEKCRQEWDGMTPREDKDDEFLVPEEIQSVRHCHHQHHRKGITA